MTESGKDFRLGIVARKDLIEFVVFFPDQEELDNLGLGN